MRLYHLRRHRQVDRSRRYPRDRVVRIRM